MERIGPFMKKIIVGQIMLLEKIVRIPFFIGVVKLIRSNRIDILYCNSGFNANAECILIAGLFNIPCIVHVRGPVYNSFQTRFLSRYVTYFISVSKFVEKSLEVLGVPQKNKKVVFDGVDIHGCYCRKDEFATDTLNAYRFGKYNIGLFGCLLPWKGHKVFIEAVNILVKEKNLKDCKFFIVGDTPNEKSDLKEKLMKLVNTLDLSNYVVFTGYQENVYQFMNKMDIAVHTSIEPEPFGAVIIEAMVLGKPVIATKMGGPLEMINDQVDGILIPPGNPRILAETIFSLLNDENKRRQMSIRAKETARRKFDINNHVKNIENIYEEVLR